MNRMTKFMSGVLSLSLALSLLFSAFPAVAEEEQNTRRNPKLGSIVTFGQYEQDNDPENGPEPIEWFVVNLDKGNHRVLLLSRYVLDAYPYNLVDLYEWNAYVSEVEHENDLILQTHNQQVADAIRWFEEKLDTQLLIDTVDEIAYKRGTEPKIEQIMETLREVYEPKKKAKYLQKPDQTNAFLDFYTDYHTARGDAAGSWFEFASVVEMMLAEDSKADVFDGKTEARHWFEQILEDEGFDDRYDRLLAAFREDTPIESAADQPGVFIGGLMDLCKQKKAGEPADFGAFLNGVWEDLLASYPELSFKEDAVQDSRDVFMIAAQSLVEDMLVDGQSVDWLHKDEFDITGPEIRDAMVSLHQSVNLTAEGAAKYAFMVNFGAQGLSMDEIWQNSDLRAWLNNEFMYRAFDENERSMILPDKQDFVTVLRSAEIADYARFIYYVSLQTCEATAYAAACGVEIIKDEWTDSQWCQYWHKTPFRLNPKNYYNASDGVTPVWLKLDSYAGVRPAVWVSMDADIF